MRKISKTELVLTALVIGLAIGLAASTLTSFVTIHLDGTVSAVNVKVYASDGSTILTSIPVGHVNPGSVNTFDIVVKNTGTEPVILTLTTNSYVPTEAALYMNLTWGSTENSTLDASSQTNATLTLTVADPVPETITTFGFNVVITGTQV